MRFELLVLGAAKASARAAIKHTSWLLLALLAVPLSASAADAKRAAVRRPDKCIAKICLETPTTQKDIVAKYGPGRVYVPKVAYSGEGTGGKDVIKKNMGSDSIYFPFVSSWP